MRASRPPSLRLPRRGGRTRCRGAWAEGDESGGARGRASPFRGPGCPRVSKHGSWRIWSARAPAGLLGSEERVTAAPALVSGSQIPPRGGDGGEGAPLTRGAAAPPGPTSRRCLCQQCDGGPCQMDREGAGAGAGVGGRAYR